MKITDTPETPVYTISRLNREAREILEGSFPLLWAEGEISNFLAHSSGHWYFSLKDSQAQVRCAFFRGNNRHLNFQPKNGLQVKVRAQVSLYEGRGDFQLIVDQMEEAGEGKLRKAFDLLKKRLAEAGLFDAAHKKPLPRIPSCIGVVTSPTGAAIRDILSVLKRRFPSAPVLIYPTLVQGEAAAPAIVKALATANRRKDCEVLILARGGGSLEDLWPFNEESLARAIYASELPVISGVGHEIDFTIADFVADVRAPTPSGAAELVTPDREELLQGLEQDRRHLLKQMQSNLAPLKQQLTWLQKHLQQQHPARKLKDKAQALDLCEAALLRLHCDLIQNRAAKLSTLKATFLGLTPRHRIQEEWRQLDSLLRDLKTPVLNLLNQQQSALAEASAKLGTLSPLGTLKRGYALALKPNGQVVKSATEMKKGAALKVRLKEGSLDCIVEKCSPD